MMPASLRTDSSLDRYIEFLQYGGGLSDTSAFWSEEYGPPPVIFHLSGNGEDERRRRIDSIDALLSISEQAPCGVGERTVIDLKVRKTKKISAAVVGVEWSALDAAVTRAHHQLRNETVLTHRWCTMLHDMLVYQPGDFFAPHRDSKKDAPHIATLSVVIPLPTTAGRGGGRKRCSGGAVVFPDCGGLTWQGSGTALESSTTAFTSRGTATTPYERRNADGGVAAAVASLSTTAWCAWFASERHEVTPVTAGVRVVATFVILEHPIIMPPRCCYCPTPPVIHDASLLLAAQRTERSTTTSCNTVEDVSPVVASRDAIQSVRITSLPSLAVATIAQFLSTVDLVALGSVCRAFRRYCCDAEVLLASMLLVEISKATEYVGAEGMVLRLGLKHNYAVLGDPARGRSTSTGTAAPCPPMSIEALRIQPAQLRGCDATLLLLLTRVLASLSSAPRSISVNITPVDAVTETEREVSTAPGRPTAAARKGAKDGQVKGGGGTEETLRRPYSTQWIVGARCTYPEQFQEILVASAGTGGETTKASKSGRGKKRNETILGTVVPEHPYVPRGEIDDRRPMLVFQETLEGLFGGGVRPRTIASPPPPPPPVSHVVHLTSSWDLTRRVATDLGEYWGNAAAFRVDWYRVAMLEISVKL